MSSHDSHHAVFLPHEFPHDKYVGRATLGKVGMWIFLVTDALMFAGFLLGYGILRGRSTVWHQPGEPNFGIPFTAFLTFLLICSSFTMVLAYAAALERNRKKLVRMLLLTALGGAMFLCGQFKEYFGIEWLGHLVGGRFGEWLGTGLTDEGLVFGNSARASTFFLITSFHGCHVFSGVTYLLTIAWRASKGAYDKGNYNNVEIVGLFWHFVDLIWIIVFTFVYLI
jgi:heme/copper-type cytochrome/quinol oxidase subunit 3